MNGSRHGRGDTARDLERAEFDEDRFHDRETSVGDSEESFEISKECHQAIDCLGV